MSTQDEQKRTTARGRVTRRTSRRISRLDPRATRQSIRLPGPGYVSIGMLAVLAPHLMGGAFAWATCAIALATWISLCIVVARTHHSARAQAFSEPLTMLLAVMLVVTVLQAIPLPSSIVSRLAPMTFENASMVAKGLGMAPPSWVPFSLDPGNTQERVLYGLALLTAFCAARMLASTARATPILAFVAVSAVLIALSRLAHQVAGATLVYGWYEPKLAGARGPLINPNNFVGYMALGLPLTMGLAFAARNIVIRVAWLLGAAITAATGLMTGSKAGAAALVLGPMAFAALHHLRSNRQWEGPSTNAQSRGSALRALGLCTLFLLMSYALAELAADDFVETNYHDMTKLRLFHAEVGVLLRAVPSALLGVGRGAFGPAFVANSGEAIRPLYAECFPLQYAIDFGIPLAACIIAGGLLRLGHGFRRWRSPAHLGGMIGITALGAQNLVDFSVELTGIAVPAVLVLAASLPTFRWASPSITLSGLRKHGPLLTVAGGAILLVTFGRSAVMGDVLPTQRALEASFRAGRAGDFWDRFPTVVLAHPADPTLALLAAAQSVVEGRPEAGFWLNRAMVLAPGWPTPHLWAARWLASQQRWSQATTELRMFAPQQPGEAVNLLCEWLSRRPSADVVFDSIPDEPGTRKRMLDAGASCLSTSPAEASHVDDVLLLEDPNHVAAAARVIRRSSQQQNWTEMLTLSEALQKRAPLAAAAYTLQAQALVQLGRSDEAVRLLSNAPQAVDDYRSVLVSLALTLATVGREHDMRNIAQRLRDMSGSNPAKLSEAMVVLGRCEAHLGNSGRALAALREAHALSPSDAIQVEAATLATNAGQLEHALSIWSQLCQQHPDGAFCKNRDQLLSRMQSIPTPAN